MVIYCSGVMCHISCRIAIVNSLGKFNAKGNNSRRASRWQPTKNRKFVILISLMSGLTRSRLFHKRVNQKNNWNHRFKMILKKKKVNKKWDDPELKGKSDVRCLETWPICFRVIVVWKERKRFSERIRENHLYCYKVDRLWHY